MDGPCSTITRHRRARARLRPTLARIVVALLALAALLGGAPRVALADTFPVETPPLPIQPPPTGTPEPRAVNAGPGDQTDPHVSGHWVAYTQEGSGQSEVRYHDLRTGADAAIPTDGAFDFLPDISGTTIVFTRITGTTSAIYAFDVVAGGPAVELAPQAGSLRRNAAVGGATVAWVDFGFAPGAASGEIVGYDLATRAATRLTSDALFDATPAVSPDGAALVWQKCQTSGTGCDIWGARNVGGAWGEPLRLAGPGEEAQPDTDGGIVAYQSTRGGETDVFFQPVGGGTEQRLPVPGAQTNPNGSGLLVAFESFDLTAPTLNTDIVVVDLRRIAAYRLTSTPVNETLNDIAVLADGTARVVWAVLEGGSYNVYASWFRVPSDDTTPPVLAVPGGLTADATGPAGATVDYAATATDDRDPNPTVSCTPPPGSTFPIGTTTVTCTATDAAGNGASADFPVTVRGAAAQLADLIRLVQGFNLRQGIENSLDAKLQHAQAAVEAAQGGNITAACNQLAALIAEVQGQAGKALTADQATQLIAAATNIRAVLGCS